MIAASHPRRRLHDQEDGAGSRSRSSDSTLIKTALALALADTLSVPNWPSLGNLYWPPPGKSCWPPTTTLTDYEEIVVNKDGTSAKPPGGEAASTGSSPPSNP
jgi:hypothetical protein